MENIWGSREAIMLISICWGLEIYAYLSIYHLPIYLSLQNIDVKSKEAICDLDEVLKPFLTNIYGMKGSNHDPKLTFMYSFHLRNILFLLLCHTLNKNSDKCSCTVFNTYKTSHGQE